MGVFWWGQGSIKPSFIWPQRALQGPVYPGRGGAGADVAIDAADVVLMKSRLLDVPAAIRLSRETLKNIHQNLFWAFFYNIIGIPLAAGVFIPFTGWQLNPMFAAAAMSLSSFFVVTNALKLNLFKIYGKEGKETMDTANEVNFLLEESGVEKILTIEGMMCEHCEKTVKNALENINGVKSAVVSYEKKQAVVHLSKEISDDILANAVEAKDYHVVQIA